MRFNGMKMLAHDVKLMLLVSSLLVFSSFDIFAHERDELIDGVAVKVSNRLLFVPSRFILYADESLRSEALTFWSRPDSRQIGVEHIGVYPISESAKSYWSGDVSQETQSCGFKYKVKREKVTDTPITMIQLQVSLSSAFLVVLTPNEVYVDKVLKMLCDFQIDNERKAG